MVAAKNGFSLIEMLVIIGIIAILAGAGVAAYNRMNAESMVEVEAKRIATQLRTWQKEADSGVGSSSCLSIHQYHGKLVEFTASDVRGMTRCGIGSTGFVYIPFQNGVTTADTDIILFRPLGAAPTFTRGDGIINLTANGITYRITVSAGGGISVAKLP